MAVDFEKIREYRKENHLCVVCGEEAAATMTKCWRCYQIEIVKARAKYDSVTKMEYHRRRKNG